jgi:hypothetical protein
MKKHHYGGSSANIRSCGRHFEVTLKENDNPCGFFDRRNPQVQMKRPR